MRNFILGLFLISSLVFASEEPLFSLELYKSIGENENLVFSPYSIQACLGLAYMGAGGKTASEMAKGLHFGSKVDVGRSFSNDLKANEQVKSMKIANKVYLRKDKEISYSFKQLSESFDSKAENLNFEKASESEKTINDWVELKTDGKIKELLSPGTIDGDTVAILVNAIYFKGLWEVPFNPMLTRKSDFFVNPSKKVSVDFLIDDDRFLYGAVDDLDATAVELKYKDSPFSMVILLPNEQNGLSKMVDKIQNNYNLVDVSQKLRKERIFIYIPKFEVEYKIELKPVLSKMGMSTMFTDEADFSELLKKDEKLVMSKVFHKAVIKMDEAGTEAAAATYGKIYRYSGPMYSFRADHPFMWFIKDNEKIYFMGQITKF